jgi:hypothetical protein
MSSALTSLATGALKEAGAEAAQKATEKVQNVAVTTALAQVPGGGILAKIYTSFKDIGRKLVGWYQGLSPLFQTLFIGAIILALIGIGLSIYYSGGNLTEAQIADAATRVNDNAAKLGQLQAGLAAVGLTEGFQDCPVQVTATKEEVKLISLQPFSIKHAGFKGVPSTDGTLVQSGFFDEVDAVAAALKAGIRTFVLQIDYLETDRTADGFPAAEEPCLLVKDSAGTLLSTNAGSIRKVCQSLKDTAFSATLPQKDDPVLVILYIVRTPVSDVENPVRYLEYLSKIAAQLEPLKSHQLALTENGDFTKQENENDLLTLPFTNFSRKFIIATNADTSAFRRQEALGLTIETLNNLDFWSNIRIYKTSPTASLGITRSPPTGVTPNFILLSSGEVTTALSTPDSTSILSANLKNKFSMMLPDPLTNPDTVVVNKALDQLGINIIPLDIFTFSSGQTMASAIPWKTNTWKLKPGLLR